MEWYAAYETLETNMVWTEELIKSIARDVMGKGNFVVYDNEGNKILIEQPLAGSSERLCKGKALLQTLYDDLGRR